MTTTTAAEIANMMVDQITMHDDSKFALDDSDRVALISDNGMTVSDGDHTWVVWLRDDSGVDTVVVWAGNDIDPDMGGVVEVKISREQSAYHLSDYNTGKTIRRATFCEWHRSLAAAEDDGGRGVFELDGRRVYVA
jgi:hypothetical protein